MVDVAIYRAVSKGFFIEEVENRIPNIDSVDESNDSTGII